jgi:hypothetical protein
MYYNKKERKEMKTELLTNDIELNVLETKSILESFLLYYAFALKQDSEEKRNLALLDCFNLMNSAIKNLETVKELYLLI